MSVDAPPAPVAEHTPRRTTRRQIAARVGVGAIIVLIIAMWIYGFLLADKEPLVKVSDKGWTERAEQICVARNAALDQLAADAIEVSDGSPEAVGRAVAEATNIIATALDDVTSVTVADAEDQRIINEWVRLYRIYLQDRKDVTAKLLAGQAVELNETTLNGSPISQTIGDFTKPNFMESCQVPSGR